MTFQMADALKTIGYKSDLVPHKKWHKSDFLSGEKFGIGPFRPP